MVAWFFFVSELFVYANLDLIDFKSEPWPHTDATGLYQSYPEKGVWINWWNRYKPSVLAIGAR